MKLLRMKAVLATLTLGLLGACSSDDYPHVFGANEVPPEVAAEPRLVTTPSPEMAEDASWMRLGDVPSKPTDFTSQKLVDQTLTEMHNDQAQAARARVDADMPAAQRSTN